VRIKKRSENYFFPLGVFAFGASLTGALGACTGALPEFFVFFALLSFMTDLLSERFTDVFESVCTDRLRRERFFSNGERPDNRLRNSLCAAKRRRVVERQFPQEQT
jgi:hypothetical protein